VYSAVFLQHRLSVATKARSLGLSGRSATICFNARKLAETDLVGHAKLAGATPLWEFIGEGATVFDY